MTARTDSASNARLLDAYVAPVALRWLRTEPERRHQRIDATLVFVDVSGFTALTERLAVQGKAGAEEVADIVGGAFSDLLAVSVLHGGEMLKWGGDASLLMFHGPGSPIRAARAAREMSQLMATIGNVKTTAGRVHLGVSAGVYTGEIDLFLLGDLHRELMLTGPAATAIAELEHAADAGEVLVGAETARHLDPSSVGERKGTGFVLLADSEEQTGDLNAPQAWPEAPSTTESPARGADELLSASVHRHLTAGGEPAEHRFASVAFIQFSGVDALLASGGPDAVTEALEPAICAAQHAAERHGVTFHYSDILPDGGKFLLTGGIPVVRGGDETRLLRAALEVVGSYEGPLRLCAGLNAGRFFVHDVGTPMRRVYSFSGDSVNLGARVMARAEPSQVLATEYFLQRVRSSLRTSAIPPFMVKGKTEPVTAFVVGEVLGHDEIDAATPVKADGWGFKGRDRELAVLLRSAYQAHEGSGAVVDIVAEPGMGKSRLITEASARWPIKTRRMICESWGDIAPYRPFRHLLLAVLGLGPDANQISVSAALGQAIATANEELTKWSPLLGLIFDITLRSTPEVDRLDPKFRRERLEEAVLLFLDQLVTKPTAFVFDDLHAADDSSRSLVARMAIAAATRPWLVVVTRRPEAEDWFDAQGAIEGLRLGELSAEDSGSLMEEVAEELGLLPNERTVLMGRAGGSPLFLRELLEAYRASHSIDDLPDSLEPLLAAQVDRLAPADRSVLRAAAVLGVWFDTRLLSALVEPDALDGSIWARLAPFVVDESAGQMHFRHALVRDAAYEGLAYRRRRSLHRRAGEAIEQATDSPNESAGLLSMHYLHAECFDQAWGYARVAGEKAAALYANVEAVTLYQRAVDAAGHLAGVSSAELGQTLESLGDSAELSGEYPRASEAYSRARSLAGRAVDRARLLRKSAWVHERSARYRSALGCITRGRNILSESDGEEAIERSELAVAYAATRYRQGRHLDCLTWAETASREAEAAGHVAGTAHALYLEGIALSTLGRPAHGVFERALTMFQELDDLVGQANVLNNMGVDAYFLGQWTEALGLYRSSEEVRMQSGDVTGAATEQNNVAEILSDQGYLEPADHLFHEARQVWLAAGYHVGLALVTSNLGRLETRRGDANRASSLLDDALNQFGSIGSSVHELEAKARRLELDIVHGDARESVARATQLLKAVDQVGGADALEAMVRRLLGVALAARGDHDDAVVELEKSRTCAEAQEQLFEVALTLAALVTVVEGGATTRRSPSLHDDTSRAVDIFSGLGVIDVPVTSLKDRWPRRGVEILAR